MVVHFEVTGETDERMRAFRDGEISAVNGPQAMAELRSRFSK